MKPIHELDDDCAAVVSSLEIEEISEWVEGRKLSVGVLKKLKLWNKAAALEALGKHLGFFQKDNEQNKPQQSLLHLSIDGKDIKLS